MTDVSTASWRIVLIAELLRRAEDLSRDALRTLGAQPGGELAEGATVALSAEAIERLNATLATVADIAEQLRLLAERLPEDALTVSYSAAREGAAATLADGPFDYERALIAARVLDVDAGWPALAACLRAIDVRETWPGRSPRELLRAFRGADSQLAAHALQRAGLTPETTFEACSATQIARLADVLDALGGGG